MNAEYLNEVNRVREVNGLASFGWSDECERRSLKNATVVARKRKKLWHPGNILKAEIAARGQATIAEACESWLDSKGHRRLLLGDFLSIGVAMAVGVDGEPVWFAQFE